MPDQPDNGHRNDPPPPAPLSPIVPGRPGRPSFSLEALRERIEWQFQEETARRTDILLDLDTEKKRRDLLAEVADYVLAQEAVTLSARDKTDLLDKAYRNLFSFGPLDDYLREEQVTEITVSGPYDIHVRRGMGKLEPVQAAFDDRDQLVGILERVLSTAGAILSAGDPFREVGVILLGRPARLVVIAPPVSPDYSLEIRLHPHQPISLDSLETRLGVLPAQGIMLLRAILAGEYGLLIVGDVSTGKTTLAGALSQLLPGGIAVERAAEMHLPPSFTRYTPLPSAPDDPGSDFVAEIQNALEESPPWLIIDEIRGDESTAVWDALTRADVPCYLWVFRGDSQPERLRSALGMVIRMQVPATPQADIYRALARHLPFVAALKLINGTPRLSLIAEWELADSEDPALILHPLLIEQGGTWQITEHRPTRPLDLPDDFWG